MFEPPFGSSLKDPAVQQALQAVTQSQPAAPALCLVKNGLNGGELAPDIMARYDLPRYQLGCETLLNMVPMPGGGITKRPGFQFVSGTGKGGGMGILGDFLFGDYSRMGSGIITALVGPVAGTAENAARVAYRLRNGEDVGAETFRFLVNTTPGNNLFWLRGAADYLFLHEMYESINPGYLRRMKQRIKRENNQTFWLDPQKRLRLD